MTIASFWESNLAPCVSIVFLLIFLRENSMLESGIKRNFYQLIALEVAELIAYNVELWTVTLPEPTTLRLLMSAIGYTIRPLLVYRIINLNIRRARKGVADYLLLTPIILNTLAAFSVFFTDVVYSYDAQNIFHRGPLGFTTQTITVFYILFLLCKALVDMRRHREKWLESIILLLIMAYLSTAMVVEAQFLIRTIGRTAIVLSTAFYYMFFQTQKFRISMDKEYQIRIDAEQRAKRDAATGLLNKVGFQAELEEALSVPIETGRALLFIDLDHFKTVNDKLGHLSGDLLLQEIASLLRGFWGQNDILGRFGGDEFCVLVQGISSEKLCDKLEQLLIKVRRHYPSEKYPIGITLSIGVAYLANNGSTDPRTLLNLADQAVYEAKRNGRNRYEMHCLE